MTDLEIIHQVVINKIYTNKIQFKIELEKVSDQKLVAGLLFDMLIREETYKCDHEEITEMCAELDNDIDIDWSSAKKYYLDQLEIITTKALSYHILLRDILLIIFNATKDADENIVLSEEENVTKSISNLLTDKTPDEINEIKEYFIEEEFYEYIKYLN